MQGKDFILLGALGGLGYVLYKWYENVQSVSPVGTQQTTNATGQTITSSNVGGGVVATCGNDMIGCITTPTGVIIRVPGMGRRPAIMPPSIPAGTSPYTGAFLTSFNNMGFSTTNLPSTINTPQPVSPVTVSMKGPFASGVSGRRGPSGLGRISSSVGFGIRRAANIFPTGIERRIIY